MPLRPNSSARVKNAHRLGTGHLGLGPCSHLDAAPCPALEAPFWREEKEAYRLCCSSLKARLLSSRG